MMRRKLVPLLVMLILQSGFTESLKYSLGPETILVTGSTDAPHTAFPHAAAGDGTTLWLVYRKAGTHVGSTGTLQIVEYDGTDMRMLREKEIYSDRRLDPRDPTVTCRDGMLYVSFFQYNYTFNMVRQHVLILSAKTLERTGPVSMITNPSILNHSSSSPLLREKNGWILRVYYVAGFTSANTDVGYFTLGTAGETAEAGLTVIAEGAPAGSFFLEPSIAVLGNRWIALWRTSPVSVGPGGLGRMCASESKDGGKTWAPCAVTPFVAHHPRLSVDAQGRIWAGFRDLTLYDTTTYKAGIRIWLMNGELSTARPDTTITIYETSSPDPGNWDCGYPSWLQIDETTFRAVYYYFMNGKYRIAARTVRIE